LKDRLVVVDVLVEDHGQVEKITLPAKWREEEVNPRSSMDIVTLRKFCPPESSDVQLCFYYRGMPMGEPASEKFQSVLSGQARQLEIEDIRTAEGALGSLSNPEEFVIASARTEELNGKRVMRLEGNWRQIQYDTIHILLDADGTGAEVQEIYYAAPSTLFNRYVQEIEKSLNSIVWKKT
jgi:hypothetical protein